MRRRRIAAAALGGVALVLALVATASTCGMDTGFGGLTPDEQARVREFGMVQGQWILNKEELTADVTSGAPPEVEGAEPWQALCYDSPEAFDADAEDNVLYPPECTQAQLTAVVQGMGVEVNEITMNKVAAGRQGPITIEEEPGPWPPPLEFEPGGGQ